MILYSPTITPRLQYILNFIGKELMGKGFVLTSKKEELLSYSGARINYSPEKIADNECRVQPHTLLFEKNITQQSTGCFEADGCKAFFRTGGDFAFDIFAASFYLLSRYEEYLPHQKDRYGRYAHENSLAFKEGFLDIPLINIWLVNFANRLKLKFPNLELKTPGFQFLPTYDIDEAYSFRHKSWWRRTGATIKDLLKGNKDNVSLRREVLSGKIADPFDSYDWMDELHERYNLKARYFFLVPAKTGKYDRNILPTEPAIKDLIKRHAQKYPVGVHPSWQSGDDGSLLPEEMQVIENVVNLKVTSSRQHYIRFTLPQTFRSLINAGISDDYSMGYGSINGFRASVASSFYWYDLEKDEETSLLLHPFCYMEANSFYEQKIAAEEALEEMRHYLKEVKAVSGTLITIWHNSFLGTDDRFKGWREVYSDFVVQVGQLIKN